MTSPFRRTRVASALAALALAAAANHALGAGFALQENSGSQLGNAFAGGAAVAEDASTIWANPAGMSRIKTNQVAAALHLIWPSMKFNDQGSIHALSQPLGNDGGDAGSLAIVPNLYFVAPIDNKWSIGIGVNAPFGLVTEYDDGWIGRYQALKSDVKTINVNPAISYRFTDNFAIGVGADYQQLKATFTNNVNYSAALAQAAQTAAAGGLIPAALVPQVIAATPGIDSKADVNGNDYAWGWNIGLLFDLDRNTRIGAHYRSGFKYHLTGSVAICDPQPQTTPPPPGTCQKATLPPISPALAPVVNSLAAAVNAQLANGGITADIKLPSITNVSFFSRLNDKWDVMGDVQFTDWSVIQQLKFVRTTGVVLQDTPENFRDAWRYSLGANYHYDDKWTFRSGVAYDQSPVNATDLTPRLPDENRIWLSVGTQYKFTPQIWFDAGFTYIWVDSPNINQNAGSTAANALIKGSYDQSVIILGGQLTYSF